MDGVLQTNNNMFVQTETPFVSKALNNNFIIKRKNNDRRNWNSFYEESTTLAGSLRFGVVDFIDKVCFIFIKNYFQFILQLLTIK